MYHTLTFFSNKGEHERSQQNLNRLVERSQQNLKLQTGGLHTVWHNGGGANSRWVSVDGPRAERI